MTLFRLHFDTGSAIEPVPPSPELLTQLKDFAELSADDTDTRNLAVLSFLYLYCSICGKDG